MNACDVYFNVIAAFQATWWHLYYIKISSHHAIIAVIVLYIVDKWSQVNKRNKTT